MIIVYTTKAMAWNCQSPVCIVNEESMQSFLANRMKCRCNSAIVWKEGDDLSVWKLILDGSHEQIQKLAQEAMRNSQLEVVS